MISHGTRAKGGVFKTALYLVLFIATVITLDGCESPGPIRNVEIPYNTLKKTLLGTFPMGLKEQSENGRTLTFNYFDPKNWSKRADNDPIRAYAVVVINGSSRPYNLDAWIVREKRGPDGQYQSLGRDKELSQKLVKELRGILADRREER